MVTTFLQRGRPLSSLSVNSVVWVRACGSRCTAVVREGHESKKSTDQVTRRIMGMRRCLITWVSTSAAMGSYVWPTCSTSPLAGGSLLPLCMDGVV